MNNKFESKRMIIIGAGSRGKTYADIAGNLSGSFEIVAVAEPIAARRNYIRDKFGLNEEDCTESWEPLLDRPKFADIAVIANMDRDHFAPAMAAIEKGYSLLLEKPIAATPEECVKIRDAANRKGVFVLVCHVLRFTTFFRALKKLLDDGAVGDIVHIQHAECVGNIHQSHSFVRGNWGNSERSTPMLVQKSCHDIDILQWLIGKKCERVQSFGGLYYFHEGNAPEGAPEYCIEGCPVGDTCPYNAVKLYFDDKKNNWFRTTSTHMPYNPCDKQVKEALCTSQYGKCVFRCDNNVVDHQAVNMELEGGVTVSFTMCAFNKGSRNIRIMGTKGELRGSFGDKTIKLLDFSTNTERDIEVSSVNQEQSIVGGHGGGDTGIIESLYAYMNGKPDGSVCSIDEACENHLITFAAEHSRLCGQVVCMDEYRKKFE